MTLLAQKTGLKPRKVSREENSERHQSILVGSYTLDGTYHHEYDDMIRDDVDELLSSMSARYLEV